MIGRIALAKYHGTHIGLEPLSVKIEFVLDALFETVNEKRHEVKIEEQDISDEDIDY